MRSSVSIFAVAVKGYSSSGWGGFLWGEQVMPGTLFPSFNSILANCLPAIDALVQACKRSHRPDFWLIIQGLVADEGRQQPRYIASGERHCECVKKRSIGPSVKHVLQIAPSDLLPGKVTHMSSSEVLTHLPDDQAGNAINWTWYRHSRPVELSHIRSWIVMRRILLP